MLVLKDVVQNVLDDCGLEDISGQYSQKVADELSKYYELTPGGSEEVVSILNEVSKTLSYLQGLILDGTPVKNEFDYIDARLEEVSALSGLIFEDILRIRKLKQKTEYLRSWNIIQQYSMEVKELEDELKKSISEEAWDTYLDIEELQKEVCMLIVDQSRMC